MAAGAAVVLLGPTVGVASASSGPVLGWSLQIKKITSYDYGTLTAGQTAFQKFTLANSGNAFGPPAGVTITLTGSSAFTIKLVPHSTNCPAVLAGGKSCVVGVQYAPAAPGQTDTATLTAATGKPFNVTASLALTGASAKASPAITTSPSPGGTVGSITVTDTATLSGSYNATGSIEFKLYAAADCSGTPVLDKTLSVNGDASYTSPPFTPVQAGTYWWTASYTGDTHNNSAASGCGAESVTISKASPALATSPSQGETVGTAVTDTATLAGGYNAVGAIEFKAYGPSTTADCSGTPVFDQTVSVRGDASYTSPSFTPAQAGTYWWTASYSGDNNNNTVASGCDQESVTVSKASPALTTSPVASGTGVVGSTTVRDTATLSGGSSPGGTIEFTLYGPSATADCSGAPVDDETVNVSGNGNYITPAGATPPQAGTYWWTGSYSGDNNNHQAATACGDESVTISKAAPAITTSPSPGGPPGTAVTDTATLTGSDNATGGIEFTLYGPSATADCSGTAVFDQTVTVSGDGSYTSPSFTPTQAGTYYWAASYSGDNNNHQAATNCGDEPVTITSSAHLYWTDFSAGTISEANLDGSNAQTIITGQTGPQGVAVNSSNLYWANQELGTISEANLDGGNPHPIVLNQGGPFGVAVNSAHIYWADYGAGTINEANLDGSSPHTILGGQKFAAGVAVDSSHLYWAANGQIWEANLDGSSPRPIFTSQNGSSPLGVAVDGSHLYWVNSANAAAGAGTIWQANLDGSNPQIIVNGQDAPVGVGVDSSHLYWPDQGAAAGDGTINEAGLDGSNPHPIITGLQQPVGVAVGPQ